MSVAAALSESDLMVIAKGEAQGIRSDLSLGPSDVSTMDLSAATALASYCQGYAAMLARATFIDGAEGEYLHTLAKDHWNIDWQQATKAYGAVTLARAPGTLAGTIPAGTIVATTRDALGGQTRYLTAADVSYLASDVTKNVNVIAEAPGAAWNVPIVGKVNVIVSTPLFDVFTVTNAAPIAGGLDDETDAALRARVRSYAVTLRRGTGPAIEYGAKTVAGVAVATAVEDATGLCTLYVADTTGASNPGMISAVQAELKNWAAVGSAISVVGGALYNYPTGLAINISLTVRAGVDTQAIAANVKAAIVARFEKLRFGETAYRSLIRQAAMSVSDDILECTVNLPSTDVAPPTGQLMRTSPGAITVA